MTSFKHTPAAAAAYDRMDNARIDYAHVNGDGMHEADYIGARDVEEEGMKIGRMALFVAHEEREDFLESEIAKHDMSAQYLLSCAARYEMECAS